MANEVTTTSITDSIQAVAIERIVLAAVRRKKPAHRFVRTIDLRGKGSGTARLLKDSDDTPNQAAIDALDVASETTTISNTAKTLSSVSVTPGEYGVKRTLTDQASEDSILGGNTLLQWLLGSGSTMLATAREDDTCALFASFSSSVGSTGVDFSFATAVLSVIKLRDNSMAADDGAVFVLDAQQASDLDTNLSASTGTNLRSYVTRVESQNGLDEMGTLGTIMGIPAYISGLTDTANAGADVVGGLYVRGDEGRNLETCALVAAIARAPRLETERDIEGRATKLVITERWGVAEAQDLSGVKIVSDAP